MYSIWAIGQPWSQVLGSEIDVVHPPGYYILLKAWLIVSDQLQWVRLLSLLASIGSLWMLVQIARLEARHNSDYAALQFWWPVAYALSGFHLVFDWAGRMYALVSFLTLLQLWSVRKPVHPVVVGMIAAIGLMVDYGFFWSYAMIWCLVAFMAWKDSKGRHLQTLIGMTVGAVPFVVWQLGRMELFQAGINGILWMKTSLSPTYFVPFFLGTHTNLWFTAATVVIWAAVAWKLPKAWKHSHLLWFWLVGSVVLIDATLLYSVWKQPLFHPRSLQFVGLAVSFYWAIVLCQPRWRPIGLVVLMASTLAIPLLFKNQAHLVLVEFYPWQQLRKSVMLHLEKQPQAHLFAISQPNTPSPLLTKGLIYTLAGKEKVSQPPVTITELNQPNTDPSCQNLWVRFVQIQSCNTAPSN